MSWLIRIPGFDLDSDDMTVADLGRVEKLSGEPWSTSNPFRSVDVAKAFYAVALERSGVPRKDTDTAVAALTLRDLKGAFEWRDDDDEEEGSEEPDPSDQPPHSTTPA